MQSFQTLSMLLPLTQDLYHLKAYEQNDKEILNWFCHSPNLAVFISVIGKLTTPYQLGLHIVMAVFFCLFVVFFFFIIPAWYGSRCLQTKETLAVNSLYAKAWFTIYCTRCGATGSHYFFNGLCRVAPLE